MPQYSNFIGAREFAGQLVNPRHREGDIKQIFDFVTVAANFPVNDFISFGRIPSNAVIHWNMSRLIWDAALGAGRLLQVGTNIAPGAIGANIDASVASGNAGAPAYNRAVNTFGQNLWQLEGQTRDNQLSRDLRVQLTGGAGPGAAFGLGLILYYT